MKAVSWCLITLLGMIPLLIFHVSAGETYGDISIRSDPAGAQVSLDGSNTTFTTPYRYKAVSSGRHSVKVTKPGYQTYTNGDLVVSPGMTTYVYAVLLRDPDYRMLWIHTTPPGAEVFVDGISRGNTPDGRAESPSSYNLIITGLQNGDHTVLIRLDGYVNVTKKVITGPAQIGPVVIHEDLVPVQPTPTPTPGNLPGNSTSLSDSLFQVIQTPLSGELILESVPPGAQVLMNGTVKGVTPLAFQIEPGSYTVSFVYPGYMPVTVPVEVKPGKETSRTVTMTPLLQPDETSLHPTLTGNLTPGQIQTEQSGSNGTLISLIWVFCLMGVLKRIRP